MGRPPSFILRMPHLLVEMLRCATLCQKGLVEGQRILRGLIYHPIYTSQYCMIVERWPIRWVPRAVTKEYGKWSIIPTFASHRWGVAVRRLQSPRLQDASFQETTTQFIIGEIHSLCARLAFPTALVKMRSSPNSTFALSQWCCQDVKMEDFDFHRLNDAC